MMFGAAVSTTQPIENDPPAIVLHLDRLAISSTSDIKYIWYANDGFLLHDDTTLIEIAVCCVMASGLLAQEHQIENG